MVVMVAPEQIVCEGGVATASPAAINSSAPISGGLFLASQSISFVIAGILVPVPLKHQLDPTVLAKCKLVAETNTGKTFLEAASPPVSVCQSLSVTLFVLVKP